MTRVMVVEDDEDLRVAVSATLRAEGLTVDTAPDLATADRALRAASTPTPTSPGPTPHHTPPPTTSHHTPPLPTTGPTTGTAPHHTPPPATTEYACVVFDRMLPDGDSLDYVRARRLAGWSVPVLFLTARDALADRVAGFEHGGDDYLVKPFSTAELAVRVGNLCRRSGVRPAVLRHADLEVDCARREVRRGGVLLTLSDKEFAVLELLLARAGLVVERAELIEHCWDSATDPMSNVVDVVVKRLRRKLREPELIHTVRGRGYLLGTA